MRNTSVVITACALLAVFCSVQQGIAQSAQPDGVKQYKFHDVGALGGSLSIFFSSDLSGGDFTPSPFNREGDLAAIYLNPAGFAASFVFADGKNTPLPSLRHANVGGGGSNALGINDAGLVIGISNDGVFSSFNNQPFNHAVSWQGGHIQRLAELGGNDSGANAVNNSGLIAGYSYNTIPDQYSFYGTQLHATTWLQGQLSDLGTLGGTDSEAWLANDNGQVIGIAFLNTPPEPPFNQPQDDAFLWSNGTMTDLGTLGGSFSTPTAINRSGQVSVISLDATNSFFQSYLWSNGAKTVLNSVGGNFNEALMLNDAATVIGWNSDATDTNVLATLWSPAGSGRVLGTIGADTGSIAMGINRQGTVVGGSGTINLTGTTNYTHAFVWQQGQMRDLNTLIPAGSSLTLNVAYAINNEGMIAGLGTDAAGNTHAFVLTPGSLESSAFRSAAAAPAAPGSSIRMPSPLEHTLRAAHALRQAW